VNGHHAAGTDLLSVYHSAFAQLQKSHLPLNALDHHAPSCLVPEWILTNDGRNNHKSRD
jgi:hypothetical protein